MAALRGTDNTTTRCDGKRGGEERKCVTVQIRKSQVEGRYMSA